MLMDMQSDLLHEQQRRWPFRFQAWSAVCASDPFRQLLRLQVISTIACVSPSRLWHTR